MNLQNQLEIHLKKISEQQELFLKISKVVLHLFENEKQKDLKLCIMSVLKRALSTIEGIKVLIQNKNFTSAAPLCRIYLDSLIRLHAFSLCDNSNDIAIEVLSGKKIRDLMDRNNKKMFDSYLVSSLSVDYPWITNVYERTSGYVHFSFQHHLDMIVRQEENGDFKRTFYYMSKDDSHVKIGSWLELTTLVLEVSKAISTLIHELLKEELAEIDE